MELLGYEISIRRKAAVSPIGVTGGWRSFVSEPFAGAWQRNIVKDRKTILSHSAVYACIDRIATDIGKLPLRLVEDTGGGIWEEARSSAFSPVLDKPNRYQTAQKFIEQWLHSKLTNGNTYILKDRDARGVVVAMYVLDPTRVRPYVAPDGDVIYQLNSDNLSGIVENGLVVPASEIIHDVNSSINHPLCGIPPLAACYLPASHGLNIQEHSATFFANNANPGGMLTAPGNIPQETADRLKKQFEERFTGSNVGRIAVAGDGLEYKQLQITAVDSQLIEQLKLTGEQVCTCFHVPAYKVGIGTPPAYNNIGALNTQYFSEALQGHIKSIQTLLRYGLALPEKFRVRFDLEDLILMDADARISVIDKGVGCGVFEPDYGRKRFGLKPTAGGNTPYLQQQNYSLAALAKRDAQEDPFGTAKPEPAPQPSPPPPEKSVDPTGVVLKFYPKKKAA